MIFEREETRKCNTKSDLPHLAGNSSSLETFRTRGFRKFCLFYLLLFLWLSGVKKVHNKIKMRGQINANTVDTSNTILTSNTIVDTIPDPF